MEATKTSNAQISAFTVGFLGTAAMAGAMFAYLATMLPLMIALAIPGFMGWILPYFLFKGMQNKKTKKVAPEIEASMIASMKSASSPLA